jgi:hypothetical protein
LLEYINQKSYEIIPKKKLHFEAWYKMTILVYCGLTVLIMIVILQMIIVSRYSVIFLIAASGISNGLSIILFGILAQKFFSWFESNRSYMILLYALSFTVIVINVVFTLFYVTAMLLNQPAFARPHLGFVTPFLTSTLITGTLTIGYFVSSIMSFALSWSATTLLLRHYSQKFRKIKYWSILCIPLVYFLIQFQPLFFNLFSGLSQSEPVIFSIIYTLIFTMSKPVGGVLFGIAFWTIARRFSHIMAVRNYMIISAIGFVLLFVSDQAVVLVSAPYPPFGLLTISFTGLSSYLILIGIYSAAVSVSQDVNLRNSIRKNTQQQSELLSNIGTAQMQKELEKRVITITKEKSLIMTKETGVESSVTEDDMKAYLNDVLGELKKERKQ